MSSEHTPGPWEVGGPYPGVSVIVCTDPGVSQGPDPEPPVYDPICILDSRIDGEPDPRTVADARLIAAAPDLLAALKGLRDVVHDFLTHKEQETCSTYIKAAEAAIAKAEVRS